MALPKQNSETGIATKPQGIVDTLGLKTDVFIAQLVNFLIILFVLWRWAYKPLLKVIEDREIRIKKSLDDAESVAVRLAEIQKEHAEMLRKAREEASNVIREAHGAGEAKREEILVKSREEISKLVLDARKKIAEERETAAESLKKEIAALVVTTAELVLRERIDDKKDAEIMEKAVKKTKK